MKQNENNIDPELRQNVNYTSIHGNVSIHTSKCTAQVPWKYHQLPPKNLQHTFHNHLSSLNVLYVPIVRYNLMVLEILKYNVTKLPLGNGEGEVKWNETNEREVKWNEINEGEMKVK